MDKIYYDTHSSPIGNILLIGNREHLTNLKITDSIPKGIPQDKKIFQYIKEQLDEYFRKERTEFNIKLDPEGTTFQKQVWKQLQQIPYGKTETYKNIALKINNPKAYRAVGLANNRNPIPIIIPCHRVISTNGKLTGYAYGLNTKKYLLDLETNS